MIGAAAIVLLGVLAIGIGVGVWIAEGTHTRLHSPDETPRRIERWWTRNRRRREFRRRRAEWVRDHILAPAPPEREVTW